MTKYNFLEAESNDSEQCLNRLQLYLISLFVKLSFVFVVIMGRYDFLDVKRVMFINV